MPDLSPMKPAAADISGPRPPDYSAARSLRERLGQYLPRGEQVSNFLKTLIWVAPLTLLIWVYAEREETVPKVTMPPFPVEMKTTAPDRVITLRYPADHNIVVELSGPRVKIDRVRQQLADRAGIHLLIDPQLGLGGQELLAVNLLNNHPLFEKNGISVKSCQPPYFKIDIDQIEEREGVVRVPRELEGLVEYAAFHPDRVKIRAPSQLFENAPRDKNKDLIVYADIAKRADLKNRTGKIDLDNIPIYWVNRQNVTLGAQSVNANITLRQANVEYTISSVAIFKETPANLEERYRVEYTSSIPNVTVVGPAEQIDAIKKGVYKVKARIEILSFDKLNDVKALQFDLPVGVSLTDETRRRANEWEYRLVER